MSGHKNDNKQDIWHNLTDAARILGVSTRTMQRHIEHGKYKSKKQGHNRLVLLPERDKSLDIQIDIVTTLKQRVNHLEVELEEAKTRLKQTEEETKNKDELLTKERERYDTITVQKDAIVMKLTQQLESQQQLLEYSAEPLYRRWFKRGRKTQRE